jgi:hypothetical protein
MLSTEGIKQGLEHRFLSEVTLDEVDAFDRFHGQDVRCQYTALTLQAACQYLGPAAGRGADVDHTHARTQQAVLVEQFQQLVAGARAVAVLLGLFHVGVVDVFLQPTVAALAARHVLPRIASAHFTPPPITKGQ